MTSNEFLAATACYCNEAFGDEFAAAVVAAMIRYGELHAAETCTLAQLEKNMPLQTPDEHRHFMETGKEVP